MPQSHRRPRPVAKRRDRTREARARETQATQDRAKERTISPARYLRRRVFGWTLVALGIGVGVQHWLHHLGLFTLITPGWDDIVAGYPMGIALGIAGAIVLSR